MADKPDGTGEAPRKVARGTAKWPRKESADASRLGNTNPKDLRRPVILPISDCDYCNLSAWASCLPYKPGVNYFRTFSHVPRALAKSGLVIGLERKSSMPAS